MDILNLDSLDNMTKQSLQDENSPTDEAIPEYLSNLSEDEANKVSLKLKNKDYLLKFKEAITQTSLMIALATMKSTDSESSIDYEKYTKEYLFFSRNDDDLIYNMKTLYLKTLTAEQMQIGNFYISMESENSINKTDLSKLKLQIDKKYDSLISNLLKQYINRNSHLI